MKGGVRILWGHLLWFGVIPKEHNDLMKVTAAVLARLLLLRKQAHVGLSLSFEVIQLVKSAE